MIKYSGIHHSNPSYKLLCTTLCSLINRICTFLLYPNTNPLSCNPKANFHNYENCKSSRANTHFYHKDMALKFLLDTNEIHLLYLAYSTCSGVLCHFETRVWIHRTHTCTFVNNQCVIWVLTYFQTFFWWTWSLSLPQNARFTICAISKCLPWGHIAVAFTDHNTLDLTPYAIDF